MTRDDYDALDAVNWSTLRELARSPLHYRWALDHPRRDTDTFRLGRATHTAILEPERFLADYVLWTGGARRGHEWEAFAAAADERCATVLTSAQYETCLAMGSAVRGNPLAAPYLAGLETEVMVTWTDEATGLACKGRLDGLLRAPDPIVVELKTARTIDARRFAADMAALGYHCQLAHYVAGVRAAFGIDARAVLIVVEKDGPHDVMVAPLDPDGALWTGDNERLALLRRLAECRASDRWPGRYEAEQDLVLPPWCFPKEGTGALNGPAAWLMGEED